MSEAELTDEEKEKLEKSLGKLKQRGKVDETKPATRRRNAVTGEETGDRRISMMDEPSETTGEDKPKKKAGKKKSKEPEVAEEPSVAMPDLSDLLDDELEKRSKAVMEVFVEKYGIAEHIVKDLFECGTDGTEIEPSYGLTFCMDVEAREYLKLDVKVRIPTTVENIPEAFIAGWKIIGAELRHQAKAVKEQNRKK